MKPGDIVRIKHPHPRFDGQELPIRNLIGEGDGLRVVVKTSDRGALLLNLPVASVVLVKES